MNNITFHKSIDQKTALENAGKFLFNLIKKPADVTQNSKGNDDKILLLYSGGSALGILNFLVNKDIENNISNLKNVTFCVLDERYDRDEGINNFCQFKNTELYKLITSRSFGNTISGNFIDSYPKEGETIEDLRDRMEQGIRKWIEENPTGKIIITQGIGPDSHTAGVFPMPEDSKSFDNIFFNKENYLVGYDVSTKNKYRYRITVTLRFLEEKVDHSILFICGKEKGIALKNSLNKNSKINEFPSAIVQKMKSVDIFTDIDFI